MIHHVKFNTLNIKYCELCLTCNCWSW